MFDVTRRSVLTAAAACFVPAVAEADTTAEAARARIAAIEKRDGGRLGVAIFDSGSGRHIEFRAQERFPMCSTFKILAAAAILKRVDNGQERLDRKIPYGPGDLQDYAPITKAHVGEGGMMLADLCAAAIQWSDNTAANLLLHAIGGPSNVTRYARSLGDTITRLDRDEPTLNTAIPGDARDTTSPRAMLRDMKTILLGFELSPPSRQQLLAWMIEDKVGSKRLRAGLPPTWRIGDKTGSGDNGTTNTVGIVWPPDRPPILVTVYYTGSSATVDVRNAAHAEIARIIVRSM
jgi:beta-lactamase class A